MITPGTHTHKCSVPSCHKQTATHYLMCRSHWHAVPAELRRQVLDTYQRWTDGEAGGDELRAVQARATDAVARQEGGVR